MFEQVVRSLQTMIESTLSEINTQTPGTIVSYDAATNRAVVKPDLPRRLASDEPLESPNIVEVPIVWSSSGGGKTGLTMPLKPGDGVMLAFQQRSLEGWLSGSRQMPDDPRQFDLSDCVAIPGCQASGIIGDANDVVLRFEQSELRLQPDGTIKVGNAGGSITIDNNGKITLKGSSIAIDTPGHTFTLETHRHTGVQTGPGTTGTPV